MMVHNSPLVSITPENLSEKKLIYKVTNAAYDCYKTDTSTKSFDDRKKFIRHLLALGHESPFEHATITMKIHTDRGVTHELVRHRIGAYSQESTRYCNYEKDKFGESITVMNPFGPEVDRNGDVYAAWEMSCKYAESAYLYLVQSGVKPEIARAVLPTCLAATITVTYDIREWRHVLKLRLDEHAHPMMRKTMSKCLVKLVRKYPIFFSDIQKNEKKEES